MPTYEYVCKACGHEWSIEQRITADALTECPSCHEPKAQRQISAGNFILKGGGWYADAYSSPSKKADSKDAPKDTSKDTSAKTETKSEAKSGDSTSAASTTPAPAKTPTTPPKAT